MTNDAWGPTHDRRHTRWDQAATLTAEHPAPYEDHSGRGWSKNGVPPRALLDRGGTHPKFATIISRSYQQRHAFGTCQRLWPELDVVCSSHPQSLTDYIASIGDEERVLKCWSATPNASGSTPTTASQSQDVPRTVMKAYDRLIEAAYTTRLLRPT